MSKVKHVFSLVKKGILNSLYIEDYVEDIKGQFESLSKSMRYDIAKERLTYLALSSSESGINLTNGNTPKLIVSLTTYGKRIHGVYRTIESIFQQTFKVDKVVLWIGDKEYNDIKDLPIVIQKQISRGLTVEFVRDIRSYTKLIPALNEFPNSTIITVDDDIIYPFDLVERLVAAHHRHPGCVCANVVRKIIPDGDKSFQPYRSNELEEVLEEVSSPFYVAEGFGGVLYPPKCFTPEVFREDVFLKIAPTADDLWFKAMELLSGTKVYPLKTVEPIWDRILVDENSQDVGLINGNIHKGANDKQLKALFDFYNLYNLFDEIN